MRIISRLDIKNDFLIKGINFEGLRKLGKPETFIYEYYKQYLDFWELDHYNMTYVGQDDTFYTFPIHADEVSLMPDKEQIEVELQQSTDIEPINFEDYSKYCKL